HLLTDELVVGQLVLGHRRHTEGEPPHPALVGEQVRPQLPSYPTATREPLPHPGRRPRPPASGPMPSRLGLPAPRLATDPLPLSDELVGGHLAPGYRASSEAALPHHELVGEQVRTQLRYYPTVTREPFRHQGRVPDLLASGQMPSDLGLPALDVATDRVMIC